jgi:hypothetical protein
MIALVIIAFFLVGFIVYLVLSNRQLDIESEIERVDRLLESAESGEID